MADETSPVVSVVMPAYNAHQHIGEAIESVLTQTFDDWELIVVDDCSNDATSNIVSGYLDRRIHYVRNECNLGAAGSRNRALDLARGQYVAFLDSDDVWLPEKLAVQIAFMESTGTTVSYGDYMRIGEDGTALGIVRAPAILRYRTMLKSNFIGNLTGIYRVDSIPGLRFEAGGHEDYVFWLRAIRKAIVARSASPGVPLAYYRVVVGSLSSNKFRAMRWQWAIYRRTLRLPVLISCFYFVCYLANALAKRRYRGISVRR